MKKIIPFTMVSSLVSLFGATGTINNDVKIRDFPSMQSNKIGAMKKGQTVEVIQKIDGGTSGYFYEVPTGFIHEKFVSLETSDGEKLITVKAKMMKEKREEEKQNNEEKVENVTNHPYGNPLYIDAKTIKEKANLFVDEDGNLYTKSILPVVPTVAVAKETSQPIAEINNTQENLVENNLITSIQTESKTITPKIDANETLTIQNNQPIAPIVPLAEDLKPVSKKEKVQVQSTKTYIAPDGNIISNNEIERAILLANDLAGVKVSGIAVVPGDAVGYSNFELTTEATNPYDGYLIGDNYGSRYTGKNRIMGGVNINSPLGIGDKVGLSGLITTKEDLKNGKFNYIVPLLPNGLKGEFSYSHTAYTLGNDKEIEDLKLSGKSNNFELELSYPIVKSRGETLLLSGTLASKNLKDFQDKEIKTDKKITSLTTTILDSQEGNLFGWSSKVESRVSYTVGKVQFNNDDAKDIDKDGAQTEGSYHKLGASINQYLQFNPTFALNSKLELQHTLGDKNLDGNEDFTISGANGVKVFPDGEHSGENGVLVNLELFRILPSSGAFTHKIGVFYDIGYASYQNSEYNEELQSRTLQDIGGGYYLNYKSFFGKLQYARLVGGEKIKTEEIGDTNRVLIQGGWVF